jgi:hypothetical protein
MDVDVHIWCFVAFPFVAMSSFTHGYYDQPFLFLIPGFVIAGLICVLK